MHVSDGERGDRLVDTDVMARAYRDGASISALAAAAQRSYSWTRRLLLETGVQLRGRPVKPCPVPVEQLAAEYAVGASILTVAERHGSYYKQVRTLLLDHGVTLRPSAKAAPNGRA
jgi:hypothetical protein